MSTLPLPTLFAKALTAASNAADLPTIQESTQELIRTALTDLETLSGRVSDLSLFSANETLEDISTRNLAYLAVPYFLAELRGRVIVSAERDDRLMVSRVCQNYLRTFVSDLEHYEIVPGTERELYATKASSVANAARRRELKIKQFQKEKEIKARIEVLKKRRRNGTPTFDSETPFSLALSLLPTTLSNSTSAVGAQTEGEDEEDPETETVLRESTLLLLRLLYVSSQSQLESLDLELELLRNAPDAPSIREHIPPADERKAKNAERDEMWKLDTPSRGLSGTGPLMDPEGKPLRPFTILPSGASERARFQSQVFGPGYDLPTMSVDEYLEIEKERGKFISGGGAASAAEPTSSERLAIDAEMDGTVFGEEKSEEKRLKEENWAMYTEANPRGAGNTMNRG